jgi:hypothetical protein
LLLSILPFITGLLSKPQAQTISLHCPSWTIRLRAAGRDSHFLASKLSSVSPKKISFFGP